jgi:hypothetical protein
MAQRQAAGAAPARLAASVVRVWVPQPCVAIDALGQGGALGSDEMVSGGASVDGE